MGHRFDEVVRSGSASGRVLWALSTAGFLMLWIGLVFGVGAIGVVVVRAYLALSERMADVLGPEVDTTPRGLLGTAREIAMGPGIHRWLGIICAGLVVTAVVLIGCRLLATYLAKRAMAHGYAAMGDQARRGSAEQGSGRSA